MTIRLPAILFALLIFVLFLSFLYHPARVQSVSPNIVISEIQVSGTVANDEFVELYNPTENDIVMLGWRLRKEGGSPLNLVLNLNGTVPAHGYFLITHPGYTGSVSTDQNYTATSSGITTSSTVILFSDAGTTLVDKVGIGTAVDSETAPAATPSANGSIERKANVNSDAASMGTGGGDEFEGNGFDSDNNAGDFVVRTVSDPQNAESAIEPPIVPTPTMSLSPTPTHTPSETPTSTPSPTNTPTQTPTSTPTPTLTPTLTPTPTEEPSQTPTPTPSESPTPSPTGEPTSTLTPTPTTTQPNTNRFALRAFNNPLFVCTFTVETFDILGRMWQFPIYSCTLK